MVPDRSSPSRVRCAASRLGRLRADPKGWLFMREKGHSGRVCRAGREPFGHTSRLEPQPRGTVTRRAIAQRRSRTSGLTRPSAAAIRGFVVGPLGRSAALWRKSFVFTSLPIRKFLVLPFAGALAPLLGGFSFVFSELSTAVVAPTTCSLLLVLTTCRGIHYARKIRGRGIHYTRRIARAGYPLYSWKTPQNHTSL